MNSKLPDGNTLIVIVVFGAPIVAGALVAITRSSFSIDLVGVLAIFLCYFFFKRARKK